MATTNLQTKTLGNVNLQSGTGSPDHVAPLGSLYVNEVTGTVYSNIDGSTTWISMNRVAYGQSYFNGNATSLTGVVQNTWRYLTGLTWTTGLTSGVNLISNRLTVNKTPGKYLCYGIVTFQYTTATASYEVGLSKNSAVPTAGFYNGTTLSSTVATQTCAATGTFDLVDTNTIELSVRNITGTANIRVKNASLFIERISN